MTLAELRKRPTLSVEEAGAILGLGRGAAYAAARRWLATGGAEGLPVCRLGIKRLIVPGPLFLRWLGEKGSEG